MPRRTNVQLLDKDYNYYLLYKIDPQMTDPQKLEKHIKINANDPSGSIIANRQIEFKADAITVIVKDAIYDEFKKAYVENMGGRAQELNKAKEFKLKEAEASISQLIRSIDGKNKISLSDIINLCQQVNQGKNFFEIDEFLKRISYLQTSGVEIINNVDDRMPFNDYKNIEDYLTTISQTSLYSFVGVASNATASEIKTKNTEKYRQGMNRSNQGLKHATSNLCGMVDKHLLNVDNRKKYDNYLKLKDVVWEEIERISRLPDRQISIENYVKYLQIILDSLKINIKDAEIMLSIGCNYYRITVDTTTQKKDFFECPYPDCGKLVLKSDRTCPHCQRPLYLSCWNCHQSKLYSHNDKSCPNCGVNNRCQNTFNELVKKIENLLIGSNINLNEIKSEVGNLKNLAPKNTQCEIHNKYEQYKNRVTDLEKNEAQMALDYQQKKGEIEKLISARKYKAAQSRAKTLKIHFGEYNKDLTQTIITRIESKISVAQREYLMADQYYNQKNENLAITHAINAIQICDDLVEAHEIIKKIPPKPVTRVDVKIINEKIQVEWDKVPYDENYTYSVIRKIGIIPSNVTDGTVVLANTKGNTFQDSNNVPSTPYYYAVFTERLGVKSTIKAADQPIAFFPDVSNVVQQFSEEGIKVSWQAPSNVKAIEVRKKTGGIPPLDSNEGTIVANDGRGFIDTAAKEETAYLITCLYQYNNTTKRSLGIKKVFKNFVKSEPLKNIQLKQVSEKQFQLSFDKDYKGNISVYYSNVYFDFEILKILNIDQMVEVEKKLSNLTIMNDSNGDFSFRLPGGAIYYIYLILKNEQTFIIHPVQIVSTFPAPRINCEKNDNSVLLSGIIDKRINNIVVKNGSTNYRNIDDDDFETYTFDATRFNNYNSVEMLLRENSINYLTVYGQINTGKLITNTYYTLIDPPIDNRDPVIVRFSIDVKQNRKNATKITINFKSDNNVIMPRMILVSGSPRPLRKSGGQAIEIIDSLELKKTFFSRYYRGNSVITIDAVNRNTQFALFIDEDDTIVTLREINGIG